MLLNAFMQILDMTKAASIAILLVILVRFLLKKAPKIFSYALWAIVLVRLLCPFTLESPFSVMPAIQPVAQSYPLANVQLSPTGAGQVAYHAVGDALNGGLGIQQIPVSGGAESVTALWADVWLLVGQYVWLADIAVMIAYAIFSYVQLRRKLLTAVRLRDNVFTVDEIHSPFVMGLLCPKIYLPSAMQEREREYIIFHEQHHVHRGDHILKALAFLALCVHWFNPMVWAAFVLASRDMEMSCDEAVVRKMGAGVLADYTASLLGLATGRTMIAGMPLAFGEGDPKRRIRNLANWKKPAFWVVSVATVVCVVLAVSVLTSPRSAPFDLTGLQIKWAKTMDLRSNEPTGYDLNPSELDELKDRLRDLKVGRKDDDFKGFTPLYSLSIQADAHYFSVQGFDTEGNHAALYDQGTYYRIQDKDFIAYLQNICAGGARTPAEFIPAIQQWFDDYLSDSFPWHGKREINLDYYPDTTFRWSPEKVEAIVGDSITPLYTGMPIWSVYFTDLTGDGLPELCSTISIGSGMIDDRVMVYDYANGGSYSLVDRGNFDYTLSMENDRLMVTKRAYRSSEIVETGYLSCLDETIQIIPVWTEQDIISMFSKSKKPDWEYLDCVLTPDNAYDRVGVVLFRNNTEQTVYAAFFDHEGYFQMAGTPARVADKPQLAYLGNGAVTFRLLTDNGVEHNFTLTLSIDGINVNFKAEDDLQP